MRRLPLAAPAASCCKTCGGRFEVQFGRSSHTLKVDIVYNMGPPSILHCSEIGKQCARFYLTIWRVAQKLVDVRAWRTKFTQIVVAKRPRVPFSMVLFGLGGETKPVQPSTRPPISKFQTIAPQEVLAPQPRARGEVSLVSKRAGARSVIDRLYQAGSARCLFPRSTGPTLHAVSLNTSGGVTGGDKMSFAATAGVGSILTVTTQACERAYRAQPGHVGRVRNTLQVHDQARLNWMPQETILFEGSALDRRLEVTLHDDASLLMVEPLVFGRAAMGEALHNCTLKDRIEIRRGSQSIYLDALRMSGDLATYLSQAHIANGAGAMASVVLVGPSAEMHLEAIRALLPETAGASLLANDILVLRLLAADSFALRASLLPVLRLLNNTEIPRCWMI